MKRFAFFVSCVFAFGIIPLPTARAQKGAQRLSNEMIRIPAGYYHPFYKVIGIDSERVEALLMDATPVTNAEFLEFVKANPEWRRSAVSSMLAAPGYLKKWRSDFDIGDESLAYKPVADVSWFAARAYAAWKRKRLPTIAEWEYAAQAPIVKPVKANGAARQALILKWYCRPNTTDLSEVGMVNQNAYGVCDLFGQVWEWVEDFNSIIIPSESGANLGALCGAGAAGALDPMDYATFMRFALRNSLKANDVNDQLGFRCVQ